MNLADYYGLKSRLECVHVQTVFLILKWLIAKKWFRTKSERLFKKKENRLSYAHTQFPGITKG